MTALASITCRTVALSPSEALRIVERCCANVLLSSADCASNSSESVGMREDALRTFASARPSVARPYPNRYQV